MLPADCYQCLARDNAPDELHGRRDVVRHGNGDHHGIGPLAFYRAPPVREREVSTHVDPSHPLPACRRSEAEDAKLVATTRRQASQHTRKSPALLTSSVEGGVQPSLYRGCHHVLPCHGHLAASPGGTQ